jgi:hypothetical protein
MLAAAILIFAHCSLTTAAEAIVLGDERTDEYMPCWMASALLSLPIIQPW